MMQIERKSNWVKYQNNPVLGGNLGTCFDISVLKDANLYKMFFSWRPMKSIAYTESLDGIRWGQPVKILEPRKESGWENDINRPSVVKLNNRYHMWYTGQVKEGNHSGYASSGRINGYSKIGYAQSEDGKVWHRVTDEPVLVFDESWEQNSVMCPHVIWDNEQQVFKMWYSGGEMYEPDAIGYAVSKDGLKWEKYKGNPVFKSDPLNNWEKQKVTACQVIKHRDYYIMFYIGFENVHKAQIGIARSRDGISDWERHKGNPIISPDMSTWDSDACYKPFAIFDGTKWLLWYNGRNENLEQIGVAFHEGEDLGF